MDDLDAYQDLLPNDSNVMALAGLRIVSYLNESGKTSFRYRWNGDISVIEALGILDLIKVELANQGLDCQ